MTIKLSAGIDAGHDAKTCGLFIARCTQYLSRNEQVLDLLELQIGFDLQRIDSIIFDRIGIFDDLGILKPDQRMNHLFLHISWHRC